MRTEKGSWRERRVGYSSKGGKTDPSLPSVHLLPEHRWYQSGVHEVRPVPDGPLRRLSRERTDTRPEGGDEEDERPARRSRRDVEERVDTPTTPAQILGERKRYGNRVGQSGWEC